MIPLRWRREYNISTNRPGQPGHRQRQQILPEAGISPVTAWRWQRKGWLVTVNIAGRPYLTSEAVANFLRRAEAGDFAKDHVTPNRRR